MSPHPKRPDAYQAATAAAAFANYPGRGSHPGPLPPPGSLAFHQFDAAARAQAAANPNLRHIGGPLGPAQMMAMAQSREAQHEKDARTMALLQYEAIMRAGQPPLPSGPMAVA